ncbi:MAG: hypothetical protein QGI83_19705 [Candidatus Latescibacteria bacterium]|nr:hypothetical protein [Candidatus Latescibacterota bacterium]
MSKSAAEITRLKDLHLSTPLERDRTVVAAPLELEALAHDVARSVMRHCGEELNVVLDGSIGEDLLRSRHTILIGDCNSNSGTYELYRQRYTWADGYLPGCGCYLVHTIHNPYATGTNAVVAAGSDRRGTERAAGKLVEIIGNLDAGPCLLPRIHETDSRHRPFFPFDGDVSNAAKIGAPMAAYCLTDDPRQGEIAKEALFARMEDLYADCNGHDFFFRGKIILLFWDLIEESEVFSDEERLAITNMLLALTRHASQEHGGWHCHEACPDDRLLQNHASHAALTFYWGARYFRKYYGYTEFDGLLACVDTFFDAGFRSWLNQDDCAGYYYWPGIGHCLAYDAHSGAGRMIESGFLRACADRAVVVTDNLGRECGYGEARYGDRPLVGNALRYGVRFLSDPQLKWVENWLQEPELWGNTGSHTFDMGKPELWSTKGTHTGELPPGWVMMMTDGIYASDLSPDVPERYTGISVTDLPEYYVKATGGEAGQRYFDKISFRDRFDPEAEYLCLDGHWARNGVHRDADTNAVVGLTWKGCSFLVDSQHDGSIYFRPMPPSMHNCAVVREIRCDTPLVDSVSQTRDGPSAEAGDEALREKPFQTDIPSFATIERLDSFLRSGIVQSRVADYGGMDWTRNIFWMRGRFFVVVDDFVARSKGTFEVSTYWQTLGDCTLDGCRYCVSQELDEPLPHPEDGTLRVYSTARLHIVNAGGVSCSAYPDYGYGRFSAYDNKHVTVLKQTRQAQMGAGDRLRIANLLYATSDRDASKDTVMSIEEGDDGELTVEEAAGHGALTKTVTLGKADDPIELDGLSLDAGSFIREGPYLAVVGARSVVLHGKQIAQADEPAAIEIGAKL